MLKLGLEGGSERQGHVIESNLAHRGREVRRQRLRSGSRDDTFLLTKELLLLCFERDELTLNGAQFLDTVIETGTLGLDTSPPHGAHIRAEMDLGGERDATLLIRAMVDALVVS